MPKLLIFLPEILIPACASPSLVFLMMYSVYKLNKQGDNAQPWRTLPWIWNQFIIPCLVLIFCFLTWIQSLQQEGKLVWYSHLFKHFQQLVVIHRIKGFSIVNEAEVNAFLGFSCFFYDTMDIDYLISGSSAFSKYSLNFWKFLAHVLLKPCLKNFEKRYKKLIFWAYCPLYSRIHAYVLSPFSHIQLFVSPWT